jgi:hypothetical protein
VIVSKAAVACLALAHVVASTPHRLVASDDVYKQDAHHCIQWLDASRAPEYVHASLYRATVQSKLTQPECPCNNIWPVLLQVNTPTITADPGGLSERASHYAASKRMTA